MCFHEYHNLTRGIVKVKAPYPHSPVFNFYPKSSIYYFTRKIDTFSQPSWQVLSTRQLIPSLQKRRGSTSISWTVPQEVQAFLSLQSAQLAQKQIFPLIDHFLIGSQGVLLASYLPFSSRSLPHDYLAATNSGTRPPVTSSPGAHEFLVGVSTPPHGTAALFFIPGR